MHARGCRLLPPLPPSRCRCCPASRPVAGMASGNKLASYLTICSDFLPRNLHAFHHIHWVEVLCCWCVKAPPASTASAASHWQRPHHAALHYPLLCSRNRVLGSVQACTDAQIAGPRQGSPHFLSEVRAGSLLSNGRTRSLQSGVHSVLGL